jgi:hypothetical protein
LLTAGCEPAAHLAWSPDGSRAAYFVPTPGIDPASGKSLPGVSYVIDADGKVVSELGPTFGSFAWANQPQAVYFGAYQAQPPTGSDILRKWMVDAEDQPAAPLPPANDEIPPMTLSRWQDGKTESLVSLGNRYVMFVQMSPDQNWVSIVAFGKETSASDGQWEVFAFNTSSKKLYEITDHGGAGACFTAASKLAYVETDRDHRGNALSTGQIVEVKLDESAEHLERTPLVDVLPQQTMFLQPTDDGLLFTTSPRSFPTKAIPSDQRSIGLYHFTRANGGVAAMSESTHALFLPSPDGKRILFMRITPKTEKMPERRELCVMNANGSDEHLLSDVTTFGQELPMWPTWHGNDEISFVSSTSQDLPAEAGKEPRIAFDVVLYRIGAQDDLQSVKTLSQNWPIEMKPSTKKSPAATQPATAP